MTEISDHESSLQLDCGDFSQFDPHDPDKALTLVRSVLTRRQQAVQVRIPRTAPQPQRWSPRHTSSLDYPFQLATHMLFSWHPKMHINLSVYPVVFVAYRCV